MSYTEQPAPPRAEQPGPSPIEQGGQDGPAGQEHAAWPDDVPADQLPHTERPGAVDDQPPADDPAARSSDTADRPGPDNISDPSNAPDAGQPNRAPSDGQLPPGGSTADPIAALWGADLVGGYRERWERVQLSFVDDPQQAAGQAAQLLDEALRSLTSALKSQKQSLDGWQRDQGGDTEVLRTAIKHYREFLDRLLGM